MKHRSLLLLVPVGLAALPLHAVDIEFVPVGDPGNLADRATGSGAVAYEYKIAKYETSLTQYAAFLNATAKTDTHELYNTNMGSDVNTAGISRSGGSGTYSYAVIGSGARPVAHVSWLDAARFVNWVSNGQGAGDTESGVYALGGATTGVFMRAPDAKVWIPTQDEWYKAAYYDPSIGAADDRDNYWLYPSRQNVLGNNNIPDGAANYRSDDYSTTPGNNVYSAATQYLTDGGTFIDSGSYYGTFDQGGNVSEWNDEVVSASSQRNRGGNWDSNGFGQQSTARSFNQPTFESELLGFRIAGVPEPTSGLLVMLGSLLACARRRR